VKALVALKWEPLKSMPALTQLVLRCGAAADASGGGAADRDELSAGLAVLAGLLIDANQLPALKTLDFGVPATIGASDALVLAAAAQKRKGLKLTPPVHPSHYQSLTDADAVLIGATLRSTSSAAMPFENLVDACAVMSSKTSVHIGVRDPVSGKPTRTLAAAIADNKEAVGVSLASFPRELASCAYLAGYGADELRAGKHSTNDLVELGTSCADRTHASGRRCCAAASLLLTLDAGDTRCWLLPCCLLAGSCRVVH
jgi:hypothetical protein